MSFRIGVPKIFAKFSGKDLSESLFLIKHLTLLRILTWKKHAKIKLQRLRNNTNMDIWVIGTSNELFLRDSKTGTNFPKQ